MSLENVAKFALFIYFGISRGRLEYSHQKQLFLSRILQKYAYFEMLFRKCYFDSLKNFVYFWNRPLTKKTFEEFSIHVNLYDHLPNDLLRIFLRKMIQCINIL